MAEIQKEIKKEFELERMILFSDAVFAIAITLLILEVKFPHLPDNPTSQETRQLFKPVIVKFMAFVISFFFIGVMWAKHLKMFKYLKSYNGTIITLNLIFLFFIVCFPFIMSGFSENTHTHFVLPVFLYVSNLALVSTAKAVLAYYILRKDSKDTIPGFVSEKKYLLLEAIWTAAALVVTLLAMIIVNLLHPENPSHIILAVYALPIMIIIMRRKLKKFKPQKLIINHRT